MKILKWLARNLYEALRVLTTLFLQLPLRYCDRRRW